MTVTATDTPARIVVTENGAPGTAGADGVDGSGFNNIRKALLDNPLTWLYKKNNLVSIIKNTLQVDRAAGGNYTNIYGVVTAADPDEPREEVEGWLVDNTETHSFQVRDNIPLPDNGFSVVLRLGTYTEGAVSQDIILIPGLSGDLLTVGSDGSGNWVATILGSDTIEYSATTATSATSAIEQVVIVNYDGGTLDIYIDGVSAGTVTTVTGLASGLDLASDVVVNGNYTLHFTGIRVYDFPLSADEITYLNN